MRFTKMNGAGNDFLILDAKREPLPMQLLPKIAKTLCDRRLSLGADGLMVVTEADDADFAMLFFNSDGTMGEMCGNGARCIARYGYEHGLAGNVQRIETTAGLVTGERISDTMYRVRLNDPSVIDLHRLAEGIDCFYTELGDPGIPHAVVLMQDWDEMPANELRELGRSLRFSPAFPKGANVNFVKLTGENEVKAITYERGVEDFTLACGTGSGSIALALTLSGRANGEVGICMPGGKLRVSLDPNGKNIFLTGPTCVVYDGDTKEL